MPTSSSSCKRLLTSHVGNLRTQALSLIILPILEHRLVRVSANVLLLLLHMLLLLQLLLDVLLCCSRVVPPLKDHVQDLRILQLKKEGLVVIASVDTQDEVSGADLDVLRAVLIPSLHDAVLGDLVNQKAPVAGGRIGNPHQVDTQLGARRPPHLHLVGEARGRLHALRRHAWLTTKATFEKHQLDEGTPNE